MIHRLAKPSGGSALVIAAVVWSFGCGRPSRGGAGAGQGLDNPAAGRASATASIAVNFIKALNAKDAAAMMAVADTPFLFRTQEWESATDGRGFRLGAAQDRVLSDSAALEGFFRDLTAKVAVEGESPVSNPPPKASLLATQLKGAAPGWSQLELGQFLRGFGDVEHVALVGTDPVRTKVTAFYVN